MTNTRVLVTGATGKVGGAVTAQLLEKGVATRALVHRDDWRSARLRTLGAEVVVADMFDIQQVQAAVDGVDRLFFNPPYHPHALDGAVAFAVAARRSRVEAVVALGQWLASPEHPSLMTRHAWLTDKLFELLAGPAGSVAPAAPVTLAPTAARPAGPAATVSPVGSAVTAAPAAAAGAAVSPTAVKLPAAAAVVVAASQSTRLVGSV